MDIQPYKIHVSDEILSDLHERLKRTRWPEKELVEDWSQGIPLGYVQEMCDYWLHTYNWRQRETELNRFDQFVTTIDECDIHFIHQRSPHEQATPLILSHGWPGSIVEFQKVIAPLSDPTNHGGSAEDAFHVVCPSLPGYGLSGKPPAAGWGVEKMADVFAELMIGLGYEHFGAQGGDWGSAITTALGGRHPQNCIGIHLNMVSSRPQIEGEPTDEEKAALDSADYYRKWDSGYSTQQRTRPQTLGYGLSDSPAGQLAWIVEKFWSWTDNQGVPDDALNRDEMLDNVMLYWVSNTAASSARLYWESFGSFRQPQVEVPTGVAHFPKEIFSPVRSWAESTYTDIRQWTKMPKGGHFAAFEQPDLFVEDVRSFFAQIR
jgi:pimeloyl-ACP methyl ester carboxylesterase